MMGVYLGKFRDVNNKCPTSIQSPNSNPFPIRALLGAPSNSMKYPKYPSFKK